LNKKIDFVGGVHPISRGSSYYLEHLQSKLLK